MAWGKAIAVGHNELQDKQVYLSPGERKTHMHVVGSTGEGKSKFLEHMIREDIIKDNGLCLVDPHGTLYNDLVKWCASKNMFGRKKIILFDASEADWTFGFNPLQMHSSEISFHVDAMVRAVGKVWGGEDLDRTPLLKRCLRIIFHVLAQRQLSLLEARYLLQHTNGTVRRFLTHDITDPTVKDDWDYVNTLKPRQFEEQFSSTINRMFEFLSSPIIRNTIGQTEGCLGFRQLMDEGAQLLVNLSGADRISIDNARLLGTLLVNDLFIACRGRAEGSRPFYVYIDECGDFVNEDIGRIMDEARKFGLHLTLAHQHLDQLKERGNKIYKSILTDAKTKVIFGGLTPEDARILTEQVFIGQMDLEQPKKVLDKPTVVKYIRTWLKNYSQGRTAATTRSKTITEQHGFSDGWSDSETLEVDEGWLWDDEELSSRTHGKSRTDSYSRSQAEGESENFGRNWSEGESEALEPILEDRPSAVYSLDEQIYKAMSTMVNQPTQYAIIKLPKKPAIEVKTPTVHKAFALPEDILDFKQKCFQATKFANQKHEVEKLIRKRTEALEEAAQEAEIGEVGPGKRQPVREPKSFRE